MHPMCNFVPLLIFGPIPCHISLIELQYQTIGHWIMVAGI